MNTHHNHHELHAHHDAHTVSSRMAASATLHCLLGCAIGEMIGLTIGTHLGFEQHATIALAVVLSFVSGYTVSTVPLIRKSKLTFIRALKLVFLADTLSIMTMTVVDNLFMVLIPGAMDKDMLQPIYWLSRIGALTAAFIVAFPVNLYLLKKGKGHALTHKYH